MIEEKQKGLKAEIVKDVQYFLMQLTFDFPLSQAKCDHLQLHGKGTTLDTVEVLLVVSYWHRNNTKSFLETCLSGSSGVDRNLLQLKGNKNVSLLFERGR